MELSTTTIAAPRRLVPPPLITIDHQAPLLVIGGGLAGLSAALHAAEHTDVTLLTRAPLHESSSAWAQGGIAAALDPADSPRFHLEDTLVAGAGLCDEAAVDLLAGMAPALMRELAELGVPFERDGEEFALGLEGGHSRRRILHIGDATGAAVTRVLAQRALNHPRIRIYIGYQVVDLLGDQTITGALALDPSGGWHSFHTSAVILSTGGAGALFSLSSNPPGSVGEGIAIAYRAGAEVADLEFVQFHPTVFRTRNGQGFLITEAARGEGGLLRTPAGRRFMPEYDPRAELAPRDIVTRGMIAAMREEGCNHALLDLTHLGAERIERRFPTIVARCRAEGIDPTRAPIPIAPAAHYLMGGIRTDLDGATSVSGLYAAGECACTGVHGANRLASNSLLECLVFGRRAAEAALRELPAGALDSRRPPQEERLRMADSGAEQGTIPLPAGDPWRAMLAATLDRYAGPLRDDAGLMEALSRLDQLERRIDWTQQPLGTALTQANMALMARLIVTSALFRHESRGGHYRTDYPASTDAWCGHSVYSNHRAPILAETIAEMVGA